MARVKRGVTAKARHKKVLEATKGHYGMRSRCYRLAKQSMIKAAQYAYRDRRQKKRQFRALWVVRINAAARLFDLTYSEFIHGLKLANVNLDRKVLAEMAVNDKPAFEEIAKAAREALNQTV